MGRNQEKDATEMAAKKQKILENGFRIFSENTIEKVTMTDVAKAAGIGTASLYRYYSTKPGLVLGISAWIWERYMQSFFRQRAEAGPTEGPAAADFDLCLESFLDLYRNHKDILRFNQFFNVYVQSENISAEDMRPYTEIIRVLESRFGEMYRRGQRDGTLRTDMPEEKMFSVTIHLMLAAVTRYAVGLVYTENTDAEEELYLLKNMLIQRFCTNQEDRF